MKKIFTLNDTTNSLIKLALPIVLASLLQMAYNITDMFWVGKIGSDAVAAVGSASFFMNLGWAISGIISVGAMVKISQATGAKKALLGHKYASAAMVMAIVLGVVYTLVLLLFSNELIGFFNMDSQWVNENAIAYLRICSIGVVISFINITFTAILNARGKTKLSFRAVLYGNIINLALDPIFILVLDGGVEGAAWATVLSRFVSLVYFYAIIYRQRLVKFAFRYVDKASIMSLLKVGFPGATQRVLFTLIAIVIGRLVSKWGVDAIAAQKLGLQIESITFMLVGGMQQSVSIMTGQAFGANRFKQIDRLYFSSLKIVGVVGVLSTILFIAAPEYLLGIFVTDPKTIEIGSNYLVIVGVSQLFMCLEMVTGGVYNGQGLTKYSATISVVFTSLRIPLAIWLSTTSLGVNGIWWSIAITSIAKGLVSAVMYRFRAAKLSKMEEQLTQMID